MFLQQADHPHPSLPAGGGSDYWADGWPL